MSSLDDISPELLEAIETGIDRSGAPLRFPRPTPSSPTNFAYFSAFAEWSAYILGFEVDKAIPLTVRLKLGRAYKLYRLGWIDAGLIKAGELALLVALELALRDRYGVRVRQPNGQMTLDRLLKYAVTQDGLTDAILAAEGCAPAIDQLTGKRKPTLAQIRNQLAHGDPFEGLPWAGLLELVHALIAHAFRGMIAEVRRSRAASQ
jgi:hypothetical protein